MSIGESGIVGGKGGGYVCGLEPVGGSSSWEMAVELLALCSSTQWLLVEVGEIEVMDVARDRWVDENDEAEAGLLLAEYIEDCVDCSCSLDAFRAVPRRPLRRLGAVNVEDNIIIGKRSRFRMC